MMGSEVNELWEELIERGIATEEQLQLITNINGYSIQTLEDVLFCQTGYRTLDQMDEE